MTQVDFYLLKGQSANARELFTCKLADKAYRLKHNVYIHTQSQQQATQLDNLLWTYNPGSFLPHGLNGNADPAFTPVVIGFDDQPREQTEVMINLSDTIPAFFSQFDRVAEIVSGDEAGRAQARQRYKFYRDRGYELKTHEINP
jgi:DNA polymerase-3 subunit chi